MMTKIFTNKHVYADLGLTRTIIIKQIGREGDNTHNGGEHSI